MGRSGGGEVPLEGTGNITLQGNPIGYDRRDAEKRIFGAAVRGFIVKRESSETWKEM